MTTVGGIPIAGAEVTLESLLPPARSSARTDSSGNFRFDTPGGTGEYVLEVVAAGYRSVRRRIGNDGGQMLLRADVSLHPYLPVLAAVRVLAPPPPPPKPFEYAIGVGGTQAAAGGTRAATGPALGTFLDVLRTNLMTEPSGLLGLPAAESQTQLNGLVFGGGGVPRSAPVAIRAGVGEYDIAVGGFSGGRMAVDLMQAGEFTRRIGEVTVMREGAAFERMPIAAGERRSSTVIADVGGTSRIGERSGVSWGTRLDWRARPSLSLAVADPEYLEELGITPQLRARTEALARARGLWGGAAPLHDAGVWSTSAIVRLDPTIMSESTNAIVLSVQHAESAPRVSSFVAAPAQGRGQRALDLTVQHLFRRLDNRNAAWDVRTGLGVVRREELLIGDFTEMPSVTALSRESDADTAVAPAFVLGGAVPAPGTSRVSTEIQVQRDRLSHGDGRVQTKLHASARADAYGIDAGGPTAHIELSSVDALDRFDEGDVLVERTSASRAVAERYSLGGSGTWRISDALHITGGLRADHQRVGSLSARRAISLDVSPRVGLTWNFATPNEGPGYMQSNLETRQLVPPGVLRFGAGIFVADVRPEHAASPAGAARDAASVACHLEDIPAAESDALTPARLEAGCRSVADELTVMQSTSSLAEGFRPPRSTRATLSAITRWRKWDIALDGIIAYNDRQPVVRDVSVPIEPLATLDGARPLFAPVSAFDEADGRLRPGRVVDGASVGRALAVSSDGSSFLRRMALQVGTRNGLRLQMRGGYVWSRITAREGGWDRDAFASPWLLERGPGEATPRHQLQGEIARSFFGVTASVWIRAASGLPFTPLVGGDINGDGSAQNDRAVIPAEVPSPEYAALLNAAPGYARSCLIRHAGHVAPRGACTGPWSIRSALYLSVDPGIYWGRKLADVVVVIDNLIPASATALVDPTLLRVQRFDPARGAFDLSVNPSFGRRIASAGAGGPRISISVRIPLSRSIQRQQLDRWLSSNGLGEQLPQDSLAALLSRNVPNLYDGILDGDEDLGLLTSQRVELLKRRAALAAELQVVWRAAARELLGRSDWSSSEEALAIVQGATDRAWEVSRASANRLPEVITPVQESLLPAPASTLVRATEPIRMRIMYY